MSFYIRLSYSRVENVRSLQVLIAYGNDYAKLAKQNRANFFSIFNASYKGYVNIIESAKSFYTI